MMTRDYLHQFRTSGLHDDYCMLNRVLPENTFTARFPLAYMQPNPDTDSMEKKQEPSDSFPNILSLYARFNLQETE